MLHSGIYYRPGSSRAINCRAGKKAMEEFCAVEGIAFELCGKVIVATDQLQVPKLREIYERGQANGVDCHWIGPERLHELEPHAAGVQAIHVTETGIVDYGQVCRRLVEILKSRCFELVLNAKAGAVHVSRQGVVVETPRCTVRASWGVNCAGLFCDRVARAAGTKVEEQIVPFRGEYYKLREEAKHLCRNLIYPTPDPNFPFLGVHFTRMIDGAVECGPNAVLATAREGYRKTDVNLRDLYETLRYPGFQRLALKHWRMGLGEMTRSWSKEAFVTSLQKLVPEIRAEHLEAAPAGVRAQALQRDGALVDDFLIRHDRQMVHVLNAPSPAATSSLNIGLLVTQAVAKARGETIAA